jgi:hypothetical protein
METKRPSKTVILVAMQTALVAALRTVEPWGSVWATGALAAYVWLAREAADGSDELYRALDEGRSVAHVALYGTREMTTVAELNRLFSQWWSHRVEVEKPACNCGSSMCQECARREIWARGAALAGARS